MEDIFLIEIPIFKPKYKKWKKYGYKNSIEKENLKSVLEECSNGYCMYCYTRIRIDGKFYANLEHAIEKNNSKKLVECVPNIGLACSVCNQSLKKRGENNRRLSQKIISDYESASLCSTTKRKQCTVPCGALKKLQREYCTLSGGEIILQPNGIKGCDTNEILNLQYDILKMEFQPANSFHKYSEKEQEFINTPICRFKLNDPKYKRERLYEFIRNIIDNNGNIPTYQYNNILVEKFCDKLKFRTKEEIYKICKTIFCIAFSKN